MTVTAKEATWQALDDAWKNPATITLPLAGKKYAVISDTHMGDGGGADDFARNEQALQNALSYYLREGFELILLGDIEEFWQFDLNRIVERYKDPIYSKYAQFGEKRVHRIFGNHDSEWGGMPDPTRTGAVPQKAADEAIKLGDDGGKVKILLIHGHQGSIDSDRYAWFSRFFVRIFGAFEPFAKSIGLYGTGSAPKSPIAQDFERTLYSWAKRNRIMLVCGHSHRAIFASRSYAETILDDIAKLEADLSRRKLPVDERLAKHRKIKQYQVQFEDEKTKGRVIDPLETERESVVPCYFNSGCGLYSDGLTCIEIASDTIRLIKWSNFTSDPNETPLRIVFDEAKLVDLMDKVLA